MTDKEAIELLRTIKRPTLATGFKRQTDLLQAIETVLNLIQTQQEEIERLKEIDKKRTWTVNKVIMEYIPDYELISLVNRYKDESFIPRVEVEKILDDRKK